MTLPDGSTARQKLLVSLTPEMRRDLRIRAAERGLELKELWTAVEELRRELGVEFES